MAPVPGERALCSHCVPMPLQICWALPSGSPHCPIFSCRHHLTSPLMCRVMKHIKTSQGKEAEAAGASPPPELDRAHGRCSLPCTDPSPSKEGGWLKGT